ncbi:Putative MetA-pathway of phenol degradation [Dyella sp. OK004]|uniref:transporter n=1 Tax=Dyella sp. OK004 TaxID=1855292 RepID=UPI0008F28477|nr:transporter [Dyella sp. OK004]SFS14634.1 Putative MetA-pathway of phenol degradation [Dyella sp. OK004]
MIGMRDGRIHLAMLGWSLLSLSGLACATAPVSEPQADVALPAPVRQSLDEAWWTGPMMANNAATLPQGHYLIEPYLYDVRSSQGDSFGSLTYMEYGVTDRLTVGAIPTFGYNRPNDGPVSSGVRVGDVSLLAQYGLTQFHEGSALPTIALMIQETFPTGRYDRLGQRLADGQGAGAYTTTLQINTQTYLWMPSGRILRMRFNVGRSFSRHVHVEDVSVYGTPDGFRGTASSGNAFFINAAWEYSLTQRWVLAFDLSYRRSDETRVRGYRTDAVSGFQENIRSASHPSETFGFAPAIEYNWSSQLGVLIGVRVFTGRHSPTTVTPAIALNYAH